MLPGPGFSLGDGSVLELDSGGGYATPWMRRMPLRCALTGLFHFDENLKSGRERVMSGKGFMPGEVGSPHGAVPVGATPATPVPPTSCSRGGAGAQPQGELCAQETG